jgi:AcrR family transcriptional regulator
MGRAKKVSDVELLDRLLAAIRAVGPGLSFAHAAKVAELAPATLVQRFGTREAMVESTLLHAWQQLEEATRRADAQASPDPAGAVDLLLRLTHAGSGDADLSEGLLLLREDFRNPVLRERGARWGEQLAAALGRRLAQDPARAAILGWQLANVWQGALIWWGFTRDGALQDKVEAVLEDWCRTALRP